ncbi:MAG TPA: acetoacetate--CoA ligase [Thermoleophilaceae bacterium]|nr:acetoacetate--CoA ligase [Thermoleophilaceae bacterium]
MAELLWTPSPERIERANLTRFARGRGLPEDYGALWQWSVDNLDEFWAAIWDEWVDADAPYERVLGRREMPGAEWFPGARLNYAKHIFRGRDPEALAIQHSSESRPLASWTWGELEAETARVAAVLRELGVRKGDRVAAYMPNIPETVAAFLATAAIGAVWSSAAPEFGARSVIDRFAQIEPKVFLAIDGYRYGSKDFDCSAKVEQIHAAMPEAKLVRFGYADGSGWGDTFTQTTEIGDSPLSVSDLGFEPVEFSDPLWILYSSGTTGLPKAIVHSQGGILLEQLKKAHLHLDAQPGDRIFWFTTTGWMMWNFLVGVLLTDASIVLFDGNPAGEALWDLAADSGMTTFGTSAAFVAAAMKEGIEPARGRDLSALQAVGSTGSPLSPEGFQWVYDELGDHIWLFSTSGGTDVCSAFVGGVPTLPVYRGELQARSLGAKVESWDENGRSQTGKVGELVITEPLPSMPIYFWGDPDGERLRDSYFSMWPGIWRHGDWIEITERGTAIIYGRSDSTINRGGIRMGTAEIYRAVLSVDQVQDALVVDVPREGDENWMPLFVVMKDGHELDDGVVKQIKTRVREDCSPRHVPNDVIAIPAIPRTLSGKVLEVPVKRVLMGDPPEKAASRESLANPEAFDWFVDYARSVST